MPDDDLGTQQVPRFQYERGLVGTVFATAAAVRDVMSVTFAELGLPPWGPGRMSVISRLLDQPMSQVEIAHALGISPPSAMELVKRLERDGYVTRTRDPEDARRLVVALTPEARDKVVAMRIALAEQVAQAEAELAEQGFDDADIQRCKAMLQAFTRVARRQATRAPAQTATAGGG